MRELVRAASSTRGGHEVDWAGDGVFLVFDRAGEAIAAAAQIQRALAAEPWTAEEAVRLRIGIHTGEPHFDELGYVGLDVVVAARICSAVHGGQVVVSRTTRDFVGDDPRAGISFRPLGSHRLKDVPSPEQLFQLIAPDLPETFPPLRTLGGATLPALHHRLVGRRQDLTATLSLLARPDVRLVTITGPGGAGKSRLALEAAGLAAVERPVHLVGLAPVTDPELVPTAIARALGVRESVGRPFTETIAEALAGTGALLFLDNLEHLATAARHIATLLDQAPDLDVLITSRAPLRLSGEHVVPLDPLTVRDASTLFAELAAARGLVLHEDALPAVREICRRLDGLPLAIELVAARLAVLPPAQLLRALDEGLALDMEGPVDLPERQRTLRATIAWSYGLLSESQRELHQTLAVFSGGCTLDDGRALAGSGPGFLADLEALVAGSLLRSDVTDGDVRLFMLETVREDAVARLVSEGRFDDLQRRHAEQFLELAMSAEVELASPNQAAWLGRLESELDNIRAALDWLLSSGCVEDVLRAVSALERFWRAHAHVSEARRWCSLALDLAQDVPADIRANALRAAAHQAMAQSDWEAAGPLLEEAAELFGESGLKADEAIALAYLSFVALRRDATDEAEDLGRRALEIGRKLGDPGATAFALMALADVGWMRGEFNHALALYEEAVELRRGIGDPLLVTDAIYNLGMAAFQGDEFSRARQAFEEALVLARELDEAPHIAAAQFMLAQLDILAGETAAAGPRARESLALYSDLGDDRSCARCLVILAGAAAADGVFEEAARLVGAAEALRGDEPPDLFELPILERYTSQLETVLGEQRISELKGEGTRLGANVGTPEVVSSAIAE
jgi:predicted ATPase